MKRSGTGARMLGRTMHAHSTSAKDDGVIRGNLDEVFLTIQGRRQYHWRAVDQDGDVIDSLMQRHRNQQAAERFFRRLFKGQGGEATLVGDRHTAKR